MSPWIALPVALPLLGAGLAAATRGRLAWSRAIAGVTLAVQVTLSIALVVATRDGDILVTQIGDYLAPFAIPFVVDTFAALMLITSIVTICACLAFAALRGEDRRAFFYPVSLVLVAGVSGSYLTGDLFNLFVFFEVMLIASYVLISFGRDNDARAPVVYVAVNLLGSTLLLAGVGLLYGSAGSVNMAQLATIEATGAIGLVAGGLLLTAFSIKAGLVPVHGWLPSTYPFTGPAVAALFSGLLTKVGVYALFRVRSVVFADVEGLTGVFLVLACTTMFVGVVGAIGQNSLRGILSFHITSQIGYMIFGLGLWTALGVAGAVFYLVHHMIVKTSLFLTAGAIETTEGTGLLRELQSAKGKYGLAAIAFVLAALSLAGLPPTSGFFAKLLLIKSSFESGSAWAGAIAIVVSFLTLASMLKIWSAVFGMTPSPGPRPAGSTRLVLPALSLAAVSVLIALAAPVVYELSVAAAANLLDASAYVEAVLP